MHKSKFLLTASPEERARRSLRKNCRQGGEAVSYETVLKTRRRDDQDSNRALAPLKPARMQCWWDTTGCSFEESLNASNAGLRERL